MCLPLSKRLSSTFLAAAAKTVGCLKSDDDWSTRPLTLLTASVMIRLSSCAVLMLSALLGNSWVSPRSSTRFHFNAQIWPRASSPEDPKIFKSTAKKSSKTVVPSQNYMQMVKAKTTRAALVDNQSYRAFQSRENSLCSRVAFHCLQSDPPSGTSSGVIASRWISCLSADLLKFIFSSCSQTLFFAVQRPPMFGGASGWFNSPKNSNHLHRQISCLVHSSCCNRVSIRFCGLSPITSDSFVWTYLSGYLLP